MDIQEELNKMKQIIKDKNKYPIFFIGAGLSRRYLNTPNWEKLLIEISKQIGCDYDKISKECNNENERIAQELEYYCFRKAAINSPDYENRRKLFRNLIKNIFVEYVEKYFETYEKTEETALSTTRQFDVIMEEYVTTQDIKEQAKQYRDMAIKLQNISVAKRKEIEIIELRKITPRAIITTNYDTLIENIIYKNKCNVYVGQEANRIEKEDTTDKKIDLYKIHGSVSDSNSIVITKEDYDYFFEKSKYLYSKIFTMFWEYPIVFMGYSISDRNIKDILTVMVNTMTEDEKEKLQKHIWIIEYEKESEKERVETKKIELLNGKDIDVTCFYLCYYDDIFTSLNDVILSQQFGDLKFTISDNVIELLIKPLYQLQDKLQVVVRELLQNALDACKNNDANAEIKIGIIKNENDRYLLGIEDNGTGMDIEIIKDNFLTVGKTSKNDNTKGLVGKYGVGILSIFLVGEKAEIYTKIKGGNLLAFKIYIQENAKKQVSWINEIPKDIRNSNKDSFTIIKIYLNEDIYKESEEIDSFIKKIGLDNYLTKPNNLIQISFKDKVRQIAKLDKDNWFVDVDGKIKIYKGNWLEQDVDDMTEQEKKLKKILDNKNIVFYNDMISKAEYSKETYLQLKEIDIPFVLMDISGSDIYSKEIETSLSRESISISGKVMKKIAVAIYSLEIDKAAKMISEYKKVNGDKKIDLFSIIRRVNSECSIIKQKCDLFLVNNKICMTNKYSLSHIEIWDYNKHYEKEHAEIDTPIIYCGYKMNKASVAEEIKNNNIICVSKKYLVDYLFEAQSSYYGLQKEACVKVLNSLGMKDVTQDMKSVDLWDKIRREKNEIEKAFDEIAEDEVLWFQQNNEIKKTLRGKDNFLIVFNTSVVKKKVDDLFLDVLIQKIKEFSIEDIIGIC